MLTKLSSRWVKWLTLGIALYLLCWVITWVLAPAALNRWWAANHRPTTRDIHGNEEPVEFRTGMAFTGEKFEYGPDFTPQGKWWFCVGKPWCPAPFVVASEVAWINGPLDGYAGTIYFVWTPFGLIHVAEDSVWVS